MTTAPNRPGRGLRLRKLLPAAVLAGLIAGCGAAVIPAIHSEAERLEQARLAMQRRDYNVALELLKSYVANNAGGAEVDQAIEMLGETNLRIKEWAEAQVQFERVLRDYPESDSAAAASYHLGEALWGQSRGPAFDQEYTQKALDQWQSYLRSYAGHWGNLEAERLIQRARNRLAEKLANTGTLYLKLRRPGPARIYYRRVLDEYPGTVIEGDALLGLALVDAQDGRRDEAIATLRDLLARYPGRPMTKRAAQELARLERQVAKKK